jgi:hypothetical protein
MWVVAVFGAVFDAVFDAVFVAVAPVLAVPSRGSVPVGVRIGASSPVSGAAWVDLRDPSCARRRFDGRGERHCDRGLMVRRRR